MLDFTQGSGLIVFLLRLHFSSEFGSHDDPTFIVKWRGSTPLLYRWRRDLLLDDQFLLDIEHESCRRADGLRRAKIDALRRSVAAGPVVFINEAGPPPDFA